MHWFTLRCLRSLVLNSAIVAAACGLLEGSAVSYSSSLICAGLGITTCDVFDQGGTDGIPTDGDFEFPQFNPNLGTLQSVSYVFTDTQQIYSNFDSQSDEYYDTVVPYSYAITGTTTDPITGALLSASQQESGVVDPANGGPICICIGYVYLNLESSGTTLNLAPYIGTGNCEGSGCVNIAGSPGNAGGNFDFEDLVYGLYADFQDTETLTLTYSYSPASAVPEPRGLAGVVSALLLGLAAFAARNRRHKQTV